MGTGNLVLTLDNDSKVAHELASVTLFYDNVGDYIKQYNEDHPDAKMVQDLKPAQQTSWIISLLPTLIMVGSAGVVLVVHVAQAKAPAWATPTSR